MGLRTFDRNNQQVRGPPTDEALPGMHRRLPAGYYGYSTMGELPVLRKCETRAKIRRGCFAQALFYTRDSIASDIYSFDEAVREGRGPEYEWGWAARLPATFRTRYDREFHRRMLSLTVSLWDRMAAGSFDVPWCWCTAEEILLSILLDDYALLLGTVELQPGFVDLDELWLIDDDYLMLYNSDIAEREDVLISLEGQFDTANLDFASWFLPFREACQIPGPISELELCKIIECESSLMGMDGLDRSS